MPPIAGCRPALPAPPIAKPLSIGKAEFTNTVSLLEAGATQPSEVFALMVLTSGPYAARFS
ncbi:MAG: hypothetical protein JWM89_1248 [Acidimicrobiales bacterium]|nr:hypothetical protein [Acidimicrobiales bacterium]